MAEALQLTTVVFAVALILTFIIWYVTEHTLSIHKIDSPHRETFYWFDILFAFALGTAAGVLLAESLKLGYALSAGAFAGLILVDWRAFKYVKLNAVVTFCIAYILTRHLGASIGDYLSQAPRDGNPTIPI